MSLFEMNMEITEVCCFIVLLSLSGTYAQSCSSCEVKVGRNVRIPRAMSLRDFEFYYATNGVQMSELYYVYQNPKPYEPYYNYRINYTATGIDGISHETIIADELGLVGNVEPACIRVNTTLTPVVVDRLQSEIEARATFIRHGDGTEMQTFWSSCPTKYLWTVKCRGWRYPDRMCPLDKVAFGLSVPRVGQNAPDNIPWSAVLKDLKSTGMIFGAEDLYWAYTYGESKLCI